MARVQVYYAHPGHRFSHANKALASEAQKVEGVDFLDLYASYPRFNINVDAEQDRLRDHDVIVFQYPVFWYATPALIKEWLDLVLEHGFAYGTGGDELTGKKMLLAVTAAGPEDAYRPEGYQHFDMRTFLTPMEQTARLCGMHFLPPYVLYSALKAPDDGALEPHVTGYRRLLESLLEDTFDYDAAKGIEVLGTDMLPLKAEA